MADSPAPRRPNSPATRIDRASLERVLARAAELQGSAGDADPSDEFSEDQLQEIDRLARVICEDDLPAIRDEHRRYPVPQKITSFFDGIPTPVDLGILVGTE